VHRHGSAITKYGDLSRRISLRHADLEKLLINELHNNQGTTNESRLRHISRLEPEPWSAVGLHGMIRNSVNPVDSYHGSQTQGNASPAPHRGQTVRSKGIESSRKREPFLVEPVTPLVVQKSGFDTTRE